MPRLLYLAYFFPPAPAIGAVRAWNTAEHLTRLGWEVVVVTPRPSLWLNPEEPERVEAEVAGSGFRRILTGHRWAMLSPELIKWIPGPLGWLGGALCRRVARLCGAEPTAGWALSAKQACASLRPGDFDLILATSPRDCFRVARWAARRLECPFVLDYRDPLAGNPHATGEESRPGAEEAALLLAECAAATVVSPSWAELIGGLFGVSAKMRVLSNGFDPRMFEDVRSREFDHFALVYAGTLYPPKRVLDPVLLALGAFLRRPDAVPAKLHYYGDHGRAVELAARRAGVSEHVVIHGAVSRRAALEAQKGAGLVVVVASAIEDGLPERGVVPGKVFDCMALGRPALVVAPRGSDLYAIAGTAGGMRCFTGGDIEGMSAFVAEVANGRLPPKRRQDAFRWDSIARELDAVLRASLPAS